MENFGIGDKQITASSEKSATTPAASGRRNAVKAFGLEGAWCAATNDKVSKQLTVKALSSPVGLFFGFLEGVNL